MSIFGTELPGANEIAVWAQRKLHEQGHVRAIGAGRVCWHTVPVELLSDSGQELAGGHRATWLAASGCALVSRLLKLIPS